MLGMIDNIFKAENIINPMASRISMTGNWSYDQEGQILTIDVTARMFGKSNHQIIYIHATGNEKGEIQGRDSQGVLWTLRRLTESSADMKLNRKDDVYALCEICGARVKKLNLDRHMRKVHSVK